MQIAHSQLRLQPRITLVFAEVGPAPTLQIGPFAEVWIDGETLRCARDGEVLAQHKPHAWSVQGREFFRVDCASPVRLRFVDEQGDASAVWGPFTHFSCADGIAYGDGMIYGNIDLESHLWYAHPDRRYWRWLVVTSAAAPPG